MNKKFFVIAGVLFLLASSDVSAATPTVLSAKITGTNSATIRFSEPVMTIAADYAGFGGIFSGRNLIAASGSGTSAVVLTFDGGTFPPNATGGLSISSHTMSVSDSSPFLAGYITVADGQAPALASFTISSNNANNTFAKNGNYLNITFTGNETLNSPYVTLAGNVLSANGSGSGPYTATYYMNGSEPSPLPISISFKDSAGNPGRFAFNVDTLSTVALPVIASITSNANTSGAIKMGGSITFTLTPATPAPGATVSGSYNGVALVWSTNNGGAAYTATYTDMGADPDQPVPLQITGVTLTDSNGATSLPASGNDVQKIIAASGPLLSVVNNVPATTNVASPYFTFNSTKAGTINYYGDCASATTVADPGINSVQFNPLANGLHSNCSLSVTDSAGNDSNHLQMTAFTVATGAQNTAGVVNALPPPAVSAPTTVQTPAPVPAAYQFTLPLKVGSTGAEVRQLQIRLTTEGFYSGAITGTFGAATEKAVKAFQKAHGLAQLGSVGPGTRSALNK